MTVKNEICSKLGWPISDCETIGKFLVCARGLLTFDVDVVLTLDDQRHHLEGQLTLKKAEEKVFVVASTLPRGIVHLGEVLPDYTFEYKSLPEVHWWDKQMSRKPRRYWLWQIIRGMQGSQIRKFQIERHHKVFVSATRFLPGHALATSLAAVPLHVSYGRVVLQQILDPSSGHRRVLHVVISVHPDHVLFDDWVTKKRLFAFHLESSDPETARWKDLIQAESLTPHCSPPSVRSDFVLGPGFVRV